MTDLKKIKGLKRLVLSLSAILIIGGASAQELPEQFNIPKRFENYKKNGSKFPSKNFYIGDYLFHGQFYDMDNDNYADVSEAYLIMDKNEFGLPLITKYPMFYWFDLDGNGEFEPDEVLGDKAIDGLNGNEEWMVKKGTTI